MDSKKILNFLKRFVLLKAYWVFPALYLMGAMISYFFSEGHFSFPALVFFTVLGALTYSVTRSWLSHEYDTDELDFIGLSEEDDPDNLKTSVLDFFRGMPYWEKILWVVTVAMLIVSAFMTAGGLAILFRHDISTLMYIVAAILMVAFLVLLMMIARRRVIIGIVLLYILLMVPTGFLFTHEFVYSSMMSDRDVRLSHSFIESKQSQLYQLDRMLDEKAASLKKSNRLAEVKRQVESLHTMLGELEAMMDGVNWLNSSDDELASFVSKARTFQQKLEEVTGSNEVRNIKRIQADDELTKRFFTEMADVEENRVNGVKAMLKLASGKQPKMGSYSKSALKVSMLVAAVVCYLPLVLAMLVAMSRKRPGLLTDERSE